MLARPTVASDYSYYTSTILLFLHLHYLMFVIRLHMNQWIEF